MPSRRALILDHILPWYADEARPMHVGLSPIHRDSYRSLSPIARVIIGFRVGSEVFRDCFFGHQFDLVAAKDPFTINMFKHMGSAAGIVSKLLTHAVSAPSASSRVPTIVRQTSTRPA